MKKLIAMRSFVEGRWFLPILGVSSTLLRVAMVLVAQWAKIAPFADEIDYDHIGRSLSKGLGFIKDGVHFTAYRPPAQPIFIAVIYRTFSDNPLWVKLGEAVLLAMIPFLCAAIGRELGLSSFAANIAAFFAAFHPALAYASTTLYPSILTTCALTLGVWLCVLAMRRFDFKTSIGAGLALAVAGMATTTFAPLAALASLILIAKRCFKAAVIIGFLGTLPVVVWMARNQKVLGRFTIATNGGYNLYLGANDLATPMSGNWVDPHLFDEEKIGEIAVDDGYKEMGVSWIKAHPVHWIELAAARGILVFDSIGNPRTQGVHNGLGAHLVGWLLLPLVLLGLVGMVFLYRNPATWIMAAALLLVVASSSATITKPRFRFPCDPVLFEFSIAAIVQFTARRTDQIGNSSVVSVG